MSHRLIGIARAGQGLAVAACCVVLVTGCTRTAPPVRTSGDGGSQSVQLTESVTQPPTSSDDAADSADSAGSGSSGSTGDAGGGSGGSGGSGGNGSGSGGDGGNVAPGSPIDVPSIPEKHVPVEGVRDFIKGLFITACGGHDLCVTLRYGDGPCFVGYDPATRAARGSTVQVLTESQQDCDRGNGLGGSGSSTDGTAPDTGSPTDVPSSGTTAPPTDVPSSGTTGSGTDSGSPNSGQPDGSSG